MRLLIPYLVFAGILSSAAFLAPSRAAAQGCPCTGIQSIMSSVADRIVAGVTPPLEKSVRESAQWGAGELHKDLAGVREAVLFNSRTLEAAVRAADKSAAERQSERTYEAGSQPPANCGNDAMGAGYQVSGETVSRAFRDISERVMARKGRFARPVDFQDERLSEAWPAPERAAALLGPAGTASTLTLDELSEAERLIETFASPSPPPELAEEQLATPAGRAYEARRRDHETRIALYQSVLSRRLSDRAPSVEGLAGWARSKWEDMGGSGDPPGLVEGRLSQDALFWYLTNMRLGSANWHEQELASLPEAGLLREIASMKAVELELMRRQNEKLDVISALIAAGALDGLDGAPRELLKTLFNRASGAGG
ncbi:MAG: hypothetical protein LBQ79_05275 [Deltaproteobacteria bacterium]|nr:hypothetical protein [Deltaproteobacteria bacterium]